jgi:pyruvate/2-oxoacid:ferredoxin oxidoreductase beta subunit
VKIIIKKKPHLRQKERKNTWWPLGGFHRGKKKETKKPTLSTKMKKKEKKTTLGAKKKNKHLLTISGFLSQKKEMEKNDLKREKE